MFKGHRPAVTQAQLLAAVTWVVSQAVAFGWLDTQRSQVALAVSASVISGGWIIGDGILRGLRNLSPTAPPPQP